MTTVSLNFPGPLSTKRRRMRSGGGATNTGVVTSNGNATTTTELAPSETTLPPTLAASQSEASMMNDDENISEQKTTQTSKCKGATTIPIFLKSKFYISVKSLVFSLQRLMNGIIPPFASCKFELF
jgi:hypothetical protein